VPESPRTVVHLLRHGEVHNPSGIMYGRLAGYHLSERGRAMAEKVAADLATRDVRAVLSSPLERARETAEPIAEALGLEVHLDERLTEAENVFEGRTFGVGDGSLRRPSSWRHLRNPIRPSWGEPYVHLAARMYAAMRAAVDLALGHEAVCVSHQLPIWTARSAAEGRRLWHDPRRRQCSLASLTSFDWVDDRIVAVSYSEPARELLPGGTGFSAGA
jgi:broad specificity phosphatase PhoE